MPNLMAALEAILFTAGDAVALDDLAKALEVTPIEMRAAAQALSEKMEEEDRGLRLIMVNDKAQLATKEALLPLIEKALMPTREKKLSQALLETLAVIAYRQPITRMQVEQVRGVRCERALNALKELGLIEDAGRKDAVGSPILYRTTEEFLRHFAMETLSDLPPLPEPVEPEQQQGDWFSEAL